MSNENERFEEMLAKASRHELPKSPLQRIAGEALSAEVAEVAKLERARKAKQRRASFATVPANDR